MSFENNLHSIIGALATAERQSILNEEQARKVIAYHGPYLLRRFADMAAAFALPALASGQGAIFARRDAHGYHTVEFAANDLHIILDVVNSEVHLSWLSGGMVDDQPITLKTPPEVIDAMLLAAISAFVETRLVPSGDGTLKDNYHV